MRKILSIIIPVYNEKNTIEIILQSIQNIEMDNIEKEIIVIDDNSNDGTRDILKKFENKHKIIYKNKNEGKGSAVKAGFLKAKGDYIIIQDADLEYNPKEYKDILQPIIENKADVVYGSRFTGSKPRRVLHFCHFLSNKMLTIFSNLFTNLNFTDIATCYKAFNRKALNSIKHKLKSNGFGIDPEITAYIAKDRELRIYEVGISYFSRTRAEGKKINWKDGVAAVWSIIRFNLLS